MSNFFYLPCTVYCVDFYNFESVGELFLERIFAVEVNPSTKCSNAFYDFVETPISGAENNHVDRFYIDDKFNVLDGLHGIMIIDNDSLLSALKCLCETISSKYEHLNMKSIGFNLGPYGRSFCLKLNQDLKND